MRTYSAKAYWDKVGRVLLQRSRDDDSTIVSDDTPYYTLKQECFFEEFLDPATESGGSILEIGPGLGGNLSRLSSHGKVAFGADVSSSILNYARERGSYRLVQTDGIHLPFRDKSCDVVFTSTVLQHNSTKCARILLMEMARVSAHEIHLFEDTAPLPFRDRRSHWLRRSSWYTSLLESRGYELVSVKRLPLAFQEIAATVARVLVDHDRPQGAPGTARRLRLEARLMKVARPVDRVLPPLVGLTRMSFRRDETT